MKRTPLRRLTPMRPWRRKKADKPPDWLPGYIAGRDRGCVPAQLGAPDPCSGRMTLERVKFESRTGKGAPYDKYHVVWACLGHNTGWCLTREAKDKERDYLRTVQPMAEAAA